MYGIYSAIDWFITEPEMYHPRYAEQYLDKLNFN
jgi:hypothetical protein